MESEVVHNLPDQTTPNKDKPKLKICCACPDTKKTRDQCVVERGQENCTSFIEAHKECLRQVGFHVE